MSGGSMRLDVVVEKATNGFVIYDNNETTICANEHTVTEALLVICEAHLKTWLESLKSKK